MYHSRPSYKKFRQRKKCEHITFHDLTDYAHRNTVFSFYRIKLRISRDYADYKMDERNFKRAYRFNRSRSEIYRRKMLINKMGSL